MKLNPLKSLIGLSFSTLFFSFPLWPLAWADDHLSTENYNIRRMGDVSPGKSPTQLRQVVHLARDREAVTRIFVSDPKTGQQADQASLYTPALVNEMVGDVVKPVKGSSENFMVEDKKTGKIVGLVQAQPMGAAEKDAHSKVLGKNSVKPNAMGIGFATDRDSRGKGVMKEAAATVRDHLVQKRGVDQIIATTAPTNTASGGLLDKHLGFRKAVTDHESHEYDGHRANTHVYNATEKDKAAHQAHQDASARKIQSLNRERRAAGKAHRLTQ